MIALKTPTGQTIRVADERVEHWEARGYSRVDQAPAKAPAKKAPAKKAATKRTAKKSTSKKK